MNGKNAILFFLFLWLTLAGSTWSATTELQSLVPKHVSDGWSLVEGPQLYTQKTLFERIDGQAELFLKYGYQKSVFAAYQNLKNEKDQIELDLYDMGNVLQAFGVFSRFRNEERPAGIGLDSFLDDQSALFYKGRYFVMLYSPEGNIPALRQFSAAVSSKISDPSSPPREIGYFPKDGLKPGSIQYFSEGLLGYKFLRKGFVAAYVGKAETGSNPQEKAKDQSQDSADGGVKVGEREGQLFLAMFNGAQNALGALKTYGEELAKKGRTDSRAPRRFGANALAGEDPYKGRTLVVQKGPYLLGAVGFQSVENVEGLFAEFIRNVR